MKALHNQLRHAVARVAEPRRLLLWAPENDCQIVIGVGATLRHLTNFKTLRSQLVEFAIHISLSSAKQAGVLRRCDNAIFPSRYCGLRDRAGENFTGVSRYDRAQKDAGHEDYERPDTFLHTSPCSIGLEEGVGVITNYLGAEFQR
jgi:hypothetical protein